jgi:hypothetical protein
MKKFTVHSSQFTEWTRRVFRCQLSTVNCQPHKRGFTLLIAALISSVVLALGVAIFEIAIKQVTLSSMGRESQFAFYSADTAAECALYWDVKHTAFDNALPAGNIACDSPNGANSIAVTKTALPDGIFRYNFQFNPNGKCADVWIMKCGTSDCDPKYPHIHTIVHADGYNTTCDIVSTSPRALQRSVELRY